jgi:hypothetical protein
MCTRGLLTTVLFALVALPAHAIRLDFVQTGGTAIGGNGVAGDTLNLTVVATLEAGEGTTGIIASPQWDLEGGNVLDLVAASEPSLQFVNGMPFTPLSPIARIGTPLDGMATSVAFDIDDAVYPSIAGPEAFFGLEQVPPSGRAGFGPATLTIGTLEFVLNSSDPTEISFYAGVDPYQYFDTVIIDENFEDVTFVSNLDTFRVNAQPIPEPGAWMVFSLGLLSVGAHLRTRRPLSRNAAPRSDARPD